MPQLELIEYSGILAELNEKLKSINLACSAEKISSGDKKVAMLRFEPDIRCNICGKIYDTEHELKECEKKHEEERNKYIQNIARISEEEAIIRQAERDKIIKGRDRTK